MSEREHLRSLSSEYAVRTFMWCCAKRNCEVRTWEVPLVELRQRLGIEPDQCERFANLKARVLRAPIAEINEKLALFRVAYTVRKCGAPPVAVVFTLQDWPKTTTGTGAAVRKKIAARRKAALAEAAKETTTAAANPVPGEAGVEPLTYREHFERFYAAFGGRSSSRREPVDEPASDEAGSPARAWMLP